ncbi:MAG: hypothetical protein LIO72_03075 [Ruminococcus sp.]|nr:hypothetical protein [Ruminococcus sp.]
MNAFKRLLLILTSMAIMLTACGCSFEAVNKSSDDTPATTTTAEATTSATTTTPATTTTAPVTTTTVATTEEEPVALDMNLVMGSVVNGVYVNEYFDISFSPALTWSFYDDDAIYEWNDIDPSSITSDEDRQEALSQIEMLTLGYSVDLATNENVTFYADNLNLRWNGNLITSAEQYAQIDMQAHDDYTFGDLEEITIGSHEYVYVMGSHYYDDDQYYVYRTLMYRLVDDFIFCIGIYTFSIDEPPVEEILTWFSGATTPSEAATPATTTTAATTTTPATTTTKATTTTPATTTTKATTTTAAPEKELSVDDIFGQVKNGAYVNENLDFSFDPSSKWTINVDHKYYDGTIYSTDSEVPEALANYKHVFAFDADNEYGTSGVYMVVYYVGYDSSYDARSLIESDIEYYSEQDNTTVGELEAVKIGSNTYYSFYYESYNSTYGSTSCVRNMARRVGDYMYYITIMTVADSSFSTPMDDILSWISDAN